MPVGQITSVISIGGSDKRSTVTRSGDGGVSADPTLPAGVAGSLGTRTDDNTGVVTAAGHGLTTADVVDVHWDGGCRYGMTATVAGNDVTVDGGAGDVLPAEDTAVVIAEQVSVAFVCDGDNAVMITAICFQKCHLDFQDSGAASLFPILLESADAAFSWASETGVTCPITGNPVATIKATNGSITAAQLFVDAVFDATV